MKIKRLKKNTNIKIHINLNFLNWIKKIDAQCF